MLASSLILNLQQLLDRLCRTATQVMKPSELFAALEQAKQLSDQNGEDLRKQALAYLLAADIQHRSNVQAWLMLLVNPVEKEPLSLQERYNAALQMAVAQRDQGQITQLIANVLDMEWDVATEPDLVDATYEIMQDEYQDWFQEPENRPATDWSLIEKLNRLVDD